MRDVPQCRQFDWRTIAPPIDLPDEESCSDFVRIIIQAHKNEMIQSGGLRVEKEDEADKVASAVDAVFVTHFGASPQARFHDIFDQAAEFAYHLAMDHPFVDGNKRTSVRISLALIYMSGIVLGINDSPEPQENELYLWIEGLVKKEITRSQLADLLRSRAHR